MKNKRYFIVLLFVSIIIMVIGIIITITNINKYNNTIKVRAKVHQITSGNNYETLYLDFTYNNNEYNTVINTKETKYSETHYLDIYCDINNLSQCYIEKNSNTGYITILIGVILCIVDYFIFRKN